MRTCLYLLMRDALASHRHLRWSMGKPVRVNSGILAEANAAAVATAASKLMRRFFARFSRELARGLLAFCIGLLYAGECSAATSSTESYPLPRHGQLRLEVPADWQVKYVYSEDGRTPPSAHVFPLDGDSFEMTITAYWHDGMDEDIASVESLLRRVQQAGAEARASAGLQTEPLEIKKFTGNDRRGFFYELNDPSAGRGEYAYLTQGAFSTGRIVLAFTILTHEQSSPEREACMEFLHKLRHVYAHQGVNQLVPGSHGTAVHAFGI